MGGPRCGTREGKKEKNEGKEKKEKKKKGGGIHRVRLRMRGRVAPRQGRSLIFWLALLFQEIEGSAPNYYK